MTDKEKFDQVMRGVLSVSKAEMQRRIEEDRNRTRVGAKRGPKPKNASPVPAVSGQN
jgi:hypothetical protein